MFNDQLLEGFLSSLLIQYFVDAFLQKQRCAVSEFGLEDK